MRNRRLLTSQKYVFLSQLSGQSLYHFFAGMVHETLLIVQVKAPLLMLLGGADLRVPVSNGLQVQELLTDFAGFINILQQMNLNFHAMQFS